MGGHVSTFSFKIVSLPDSDSVEDRIMAHLAPPSLRSSEQGMSVDT